MSYAIDEEDDENGQSVQSGQQSSIISGQGTAPGASGPKTPDRPGNFVGLQTYLDANKAQSSKFGNQVVDNINNTTTNANTAIDKAGVDFNSKINSSNPISNTGLVDKVKAGTVLSTEEENSWGKHRDNPNNTTNSIEETELYAPVATVIKTAKDKGSLIGSEAGTTSLINDQFKSPDYSRGQQRFDSYLLNSDENKTKLNQQKQEIDKLEPKFGNISTSAQRYAAGEKARVANEQKAAKDALGLFDDPATPEVDESAGAFGSLQKYLREQAKKNTLVDDLATPQDESDPWKEMATSNSLTPEMLAALGLSADQDLYGIDLNAYLKKSPIAATEQNMATQADLDKYKALMRLTGTPQAGSYLEGGKIGGFVPYNADKSGLIAKLGDRAKKTEDWNKVIADAGAASDAYARFDAQMGSNDDERRVNLLNEGNRNLHAALLAEAQRTVADREAFRTANPWLHTPTKAKLKN